MNELIQNARNALQNAYAPYSGFRVGAAAITSDNKIFTGCNVENSSYGLTVCAERNAIFHAVAKGHKDIDTLALITETDEPVTPCGACRQVLAEFNPDMTIVMATVSGKQSSKKLDALLPHAFQLSTKK